MMNKPIISDNFTIEDIHKIREWHSKERERIGRDEYNKNMNLKVLELIKDLPRAKCISL